MCLPALNGKVLQDIKAGRRTKTLYTTKDLFIKRILAFTSSLSTSFIYDVYINMKRCLLTQISVNAREV